MPIFVGRDLLDAFESDAIDQQAKLTQQAITSAPPLPPPDYSNAPPPAEAQPDQTQPDQAAEPPPEQPPPLPAPPPAPVTPPPVAPPPVAPPAVAPSPADNPISLQSLPSLQDLLARAGLPSQPLGSAAATTTQDAAAPVTFAPRPAPQTGQSAGPPALSDLLNAAGLGDLGNTVQVAAGPAASALTNGSPPALNDLLNTAGLAGQQASNAVTQKVDQVQAAVQEIGGKVAARTSQFAMGLDDNDAYAFCGPAAAIAFAQTYGRNPTAAEAKELAQKVGWNADQGMAGVASEQQLLKNMGIPTHLETDVNWQHVAQDASSGNPVILSTPGHYYYVSGTRTNAQGQTEFDVGTSGTDLRGGKEWMTADQINAMPQSKGSVAGALYADNPSSPNSSVATAQPVTQTTAGMSGGGDQAGTLGDRGMQILNGAANAASWLGDQGQKAIQSVLVTEGGLNNARGDQGRSAGPLQFYEGGQLANLAQQMGMNLDQAKNWVEQNPIAAVQWAVGTPDKPGYLGAAIQRGIQQGLSGADLATYAQRTGQVSDSPERAGANWQALFGSGQGLVQSAATAVQGAATAAGQGAQDLVGRGTDLINQGQALIDQASQGTQSLADYTRQKLTPIEDEANRTMASLSGAADQTLQANQAAQEQRSIAANQATLGGGLLGRGAEFTAGSDAQTPEQILAAQPPPSPPQGPLDIVKQKFSDALDAFGSLLGGAGSAVQQGVSALGQAGQTAPPEGGGYSAAPAGAPGAGQAELGQAATQVGQTLQSAAQSPYVPSEILRSGERAVVQNALVPAASYVLSGQARSDLANEIESEADNAPLGPTIPAPVQSVGLKLVAGLLRSPDVADAFNKAMAVQQKYGNTDISQWSPEDRDTYSQGIIAVGGIVSPVGGGGGGLSGDEYLAQLAKAEDAVSALRTQFPQMTEGSLAASGPGKALAALRAMGAPAEEAAPAAASATGAAEAQAGASATTGGAEAPAGAGATTETPQAAPAPSPVPANLSEPAPQPQGSADLLQAMVDQAKARGVHPGDLEAAQQQIDQIRAQENGTQMTAQSLTQRLRELTARVNGGEPLLGDATGGLPPNESLPTGPQRGQLPLGAEFGRTLPVGDRPLPTSGPQPPSPPIPGQLPLGEAFGRTLPVGGGPGVRRVAEQLGADTEPSRAFDVNALAQMRAQYQAQQAPLLAGAGQIAKRTPLDNFIGYTMANMLWGVGTAVHITTSQMLQTLGRPAVEVASGHPVEAVRDLAMMGGTISDAFAAFGRTIQTGRRQGFALQTPPLPGAAGAVLGFPLRVHSAVNEFFRTLNSAGASAAEVSRLMRENPDLNFEDVLQRFPQQIMDAGADAAARATFMEGGGVMKDIGQKLGQVSRDLMNDPRTMPAGLVMRWIMPMTHIPAVILGEGVRGLPVVNEVRGLQRTIQLARGTPTRTLSSGQVVPAVAGDTYRAQQEFGRTALTSFVNVAILSEVAQGNITGSGPTSPAERERLMEAVDDQGNAMWRPNSIRLPGGRWVDYTGLGPVALSMSSIANLVDVAKDYAEKPPEQRTGGAPELAGELLNREAGTIGQTWFLRGLADALGMIKDGNVSTSAGSEVGSIGDRLVPFGALLNEVRGFTDPLQRNPQNPLERVESRVPILSANVQPRLAASTGEPMGKPQDVGSLLFRGTPPGMLTPNPVAAEVARLHDQGVAVSLPYEVKSYKGAEQSAQQQQTIRQQVGQAVNLYAANTLRDPRYQNLDDQQKANALSQSVGQAQSAADLTLDNQVARSPHDSALLLWAQTPHYAAVSGTPEEIARQNWEIEQAKAKLAQYRTQYPNSYESRLRQDDPQAFRLSQRDPLDSDVLKRRKAAVDRATGGQLSQATDKAAAGGLVGAGTTTLRAPIP